MTKQEIEARLARWRRVEQKYEERQRRQWYWGGKYTIILTVARASILELEKMLCDGNTRSS